MQTLTINAFQSFQAMLDDQPVDFRGAKEQALLIYLALEQGPAHRVGIDRHVQPRIHTRSSLAGLLWPDESESKARRHLSTTLLRLRNAIGDRGNTRPFLRVDTHTLAISPNASLWLDAATFREILAGVDCHEHTNLHTCAHCTDQYRQAVDLYHGPFLADFIVGSDLFEEWRTAQQMRFDQQACDALAQLGMCYAAQGQQARALATTRRQLLLQPISEEVHRTLMQLLAQNGQRSAALAQYDMLTQILLDELGVSPARETDALYDQIVAGEVCVRSGIIMGVHCAAGDPAEIQAAKTQKVATENAGPFATPSAQPVPLIAQPAIAQSAIVQPAIVQPAIVQPAIVQPAIVQPERAVHKVEHRLDDWRDGGHTPAMSGISSYIANEAGVDQQHPPSQFVAGPPITQPHLFFGHGDTLSRIFSWWKVLPLPHVALIGPRRSGKTSLLRYLQSIGTVPQSMLRPAQKQNWLPSPERYHWIEVNFQDPRMCSQNRVLRHLLTGFGLHAPNHCSLETFMDIAESHAWTEPTIVLMDELGTGLAAPELNQSFWWALRALTQATNGCLAFVVAACNQPVRLAEEMGKVSPFFNIFTTIKLGPFTQHEALDLIASSPVPFAETDSEWIREQSGCWPYLLQFCCQERLRALEAGHVGEGWKEAALERIEPFAYLKGGKR